MSSCSDTGQLGGDVLCQPAAGQGGFEYSGDLEPPDQGDHQALAALCSDETPLTLQLKQSLGPNIHPSCVGRETLM